MIDEFQQKLEQAELSKQEKIRDVQNSKAQEIKVYLERLKEEESKNQEYMEHIQELNDEISQLQREAQQSDRQKKTL